MYMLHLRVALLLSLSAFSEAKTFSKSKDAVLLSNVRSLTLLADKPTSYRRVSSIPQLTCVGGNAKGLYNVDVMRCTNSGSEYHSEDIQWTCHASLPPEFKLGSTEVVCEGYDGPDDPYILKGSCGVEYRLILTDMGEAKYAGQAFDGHSNMPYGHRSWGGTSNSVLNKFWSLFFWAVFIAVVCVILYKVFFPERRIALPNLGFNGGGGGGGGGGYNDDPPPPYTPRAPPRPKSESASRSTPRTSSRNQSSSGPGFWSGAATGGAAGYGAGYFVGQRNRNRERERSRERQRERERERERERLHQSSLFGSPGPSSPPRSNGFFGGGGGGSGSSSRPSPSGSRYESTGFGGTRRR